MKEIWSILLSVYMSISSSFSEGCEEFISDADDEHEERHQKVVAETEREKYLVSNAWSDEQNAKLDKANEKIRNATSTCLAECTPKNLDDWSLERCVGRCSRAIKDHAFDD